MGWGQVLQSDTKSRQVIVCRSTVPRQCMNARPDPDLAGFTGEVPSDKL